MNPSTRKISVSQLSLYNPARLSDEEIIATFAARQIIFDRIIADVGSETPRSRAQHHLIVGQRGMGKSTLLARLGAELRQRPDLSSKFLPLVFAEEQYAVDRLSKFWLNCLDSLADACEREKNDAAADRIDKRVHELSSSVGSSSVQSEEHATAALDAFLSEARALQRRPVLLVDNLQLVFERLSSEEQHRLRELLMRQGSPILVGASPSPPPESQDYGAAFYDHFKVHYLPPLSVEEMRLLMLTLAEKVERTDVRDRILQHPHRLDVLRQLTGGNPRTTVTLFFLYAEDFSSSVFGDLENLLDRVTPLYKARFEELSTQQQVVASAIANHWDPVTARGLADVTSLPATGISSQLDRLEKTGVIERVNLFGDSAIGYQLAERFFNVWFLMRNASRRQRREVEFLTRFIESFYEAQDRSLLARRLLAEHDFTPDRHLFAQALACTLGKDEARDLRRHAELDALFQKETDARRRLEEVIDFSKLQPAALKFVDLREKLADLVPADAAVPPGDFASEVLGDRELFKTGYRERLASRRELSAEEVQKLAESIDVSRTRDIEEYGRDAVQWLTDRLASGQLSALDDVDDWNAAFRQAPQAPMLELLTDTVPSSVGSLLSADATSRIRENLEPRAPATPAAWNRWALRLELRLRDFKEAEDAYRAAIALDEKLAAPWLRLGNLFQYRLFRYEEAEGAYRKAITLDDELAAPWLRLGNLFQYRLNRYEEAEDAYRSAIALDEELAVPWLRLGNLFQYRSCRYEEAEMAYRKAIALDENFATPWTGLGNLLQYCLHRHEEAEAAYRRAIVLDELSAAPWFGLGVVLHYDLGRYEEAEEAYRKAIALNEKFMEPWIELGNLFNYRINRPEEAEAAYRRAIVLDESAAAPWHGLGVVLHHDLGRDTEAEEALRKAIVLDQKLAEPWVELGKLLHYKFRRYEKAEAAYREAIVLDQKLAEPWFYLGNLFQYRIPRYEEAEVAYRKAIVLDDKLGEPWENLGVLLQNHFHRYEEAEAAYRKAIAQGKQDSRLWNRLGSLLYDDLNRFTDAAEAFERASVLDPSRTAAAHNLLFLHRDFLGEGGAALPRFYRFLAAPGNDFADTIELHHALFSGYAENWGLAREALGRALGHVESGFPSNTQDDWLRASAVFLHLNYGEPFLDFLREQGADSRLRPWYEAIVASQSGDRRHLQNLAPEIRVTAEVYFDRIAKRLAALPAKTRRRPLPTTPKTKKKLRHPKA